MSQERAQTAQVTGECAAHHLEGLHPNFYPTNLYLESDFLQFITFTFGSVVIVEMLFRCTFCVNKGSKSFPLLGGKSFFNAQDGNGLLHDCISISVVVNSEMRMVTLAVYPSEHICTKEIMTNDTVESNFLFFL